jgi:hypothetical protein
VPAERQNAAGRVRDSKENQMKRMLGLVLALAVMVGMSMPSFAQDKKAAPAAEKKEGKEGEAKKSETAKKNEKKGEKKKGEKKDEKKDEKKSDKK